MDLKELYQEIILDHAKNPRNKGKCEGYNHDAKAHNPLCGDKVHIYLKLDKDKNISGLSFEGGVFTDDQIDAYIELKFQEIYNFEHTPHPIEFEMYYSG